MVNLFKFKGDLAVLKQIAYSASHCSKLDPDQQDEAKYAYVLITEMQDMIRQDEIDHMLDKCLTK